MFFAFALAAFGQPTSVIGTITSIDAVKGEMTVKRDSGESVEVKVAVDLPVKQVQPGEKDLTKAQVVALAGLANGDRVLVRGALTEKTVTANSLIVISARDIKKRDDQERQEWTRRGMVGVVDAVDAAKGEVTIKTQSMAGPKPVTVVLGDKTVYKRYAPDSIKFADAKDATMKDLKKGDQLRVLGDKNEDATRITAERAVFGSFRTVAGTVTAVDPAAGEVKIKDLASGKAMLVRIKPDSQVKKMPNFAGMMGGMGGGPGGPGGGPGGGMGMAGGRPPGAGGPPPAAASGRPAGAPGAGGPPGGPPSGMMGGGRPGGGDMMAMLDRMPPAKIEDIKVGESIVVSSTVGAKSDEITAITLLANADMIIAMAQRQSGGAGGAPGGLGGLSLGGGGMEMGMGMIPMQ
ncbi:MAG: hypothetical protein K2X03_20775 [Bryobacteraceae bacterium]|nr:hypothetical protein [Bryobacteraceae bacterium]